MKRDRFNECYKCIHKRDVPGNAHIKCVKPDADMIGNQYGISNGWFLYPSLFDPTWKMVMCKNYENREHARLVGAMLSAMMLIQTMREVASVGKILLHIGKDDDVSYWNLGCYIDCVVR